MRLYTYVATGLLSAAIAAVGVWNLQKWRYDATIARMTQGAAERTTVAVKAAMDKMQVDQKRKDDAIAEANKRANYNAAAATRARNAADSLRDELATARVHMSSANESARAKYAATVETVLGECSREYQSMAEKADGHANDAVMLKESWPR